MQARVANARRCLWPLNTVRRKRDRAACACAHELDRIFDLAAVGGALRDFAALTAIFAKVGVAHINSDLATFIRTCVILLTLALIVYRHRPIPESGVDIAAHLPVPGAFGTGDGGFSGCGYFRALKLGNAAQVAPVDKLQRRAGRHLRRRCCWAKS